MHGVLEQLERLAGRHYQAAADRPVRILGAEDRRAGVVDPARPEEESLLGPLRVEGELVEGEVDHPEHPHELRRERAEVGRGPAEVAHGLTRDPGEWPQLVLDDRRRVVQERPGRRQRRAQGAGGRPEVLERRDEVVGEHLGLDAAARCVAKQGTMP